MQETQPPEVSETLKEFFTGKSDEDVAAKMDKRLSELKAQQHTLVRRVKIGRNDPCPCGSGLKFKRCCIGKAT